MGIASNTPAGVSCAQSASPLGANSDAIIRKGNYATDNGISLSDARARARLKDDAMTRSGKKALNDEQNRRRKICIRDRWKCRYCGKDFSHLSEDIAAFKSARAEGPVIDHILPKSRGGDNSDENLGCCCWQCNSSKKNKTVEEYRHHCSYLRNSTYRAICQLQQAQIEHSTPFNHEIQLAIDWLFRQNPIVAFYFEAENANSEDLSQKGI